ncbi:MULTISPECIES: carbonic anhydrase [Paenibacillus]|uniref:carbonic anhydrase n=1 Tax=Paenibacillus TaxID=44249 RepID=UPI0022B86002|nr:carbonic anhydrase family protein [Paenibacillus caseinilyticus]MCZ8523192.1 carbonic anhydrase family protein [Paenibacillus caseinilyticus]
MLPTKWLPVLLSASLALTLGACSAKTAAPAETPKAGTPQTQTPPAAHPAHWSYSGESGPADWAKLDQTFAACANGTEQSPVDIELSHTKVDKTAVNVQLHYQPSAFTLMNNGHTIQANEASGSDTITVDGTEYKLAQMHFHRPSENEIDGQSFAMEGHLVHKNKEGGLAVVGFLMKAGKENKQLAEMWSKLPKQETKEDVKLEQPVDLPALLPASAHAFRYEGSLTTPPCSEHVKWIVLADPVEVSQEQIDAFAAIFPDNHRPVQPLNQRTVVSN